MIHCKIYIYSTSEHISQLCTGFQLLESQKKIELSYNFNAYSRNGKTPLQTVRPYDLQGMFVVVNNTITIFYDTTDGERLLTEALEVSDFYFKRSYRPQAIPDQYKDVVFPLGLNYEVYTGMFDKLEFSRFFANSRNFKSPKELLKSVLRNIGLKYNPTINNMHRAPQRAHKPKVLFMARTWNPDNYTGGYPAENWEVWKSLCNNINKTRATVIRTLRKELGYQFYGGFSQNQYTADNYRDLLLSDEGASAKKRYINRLSEYPICIATTGLYNSIGWKFGEYVAFSKAIVSEKLNHHVPGDFERGKNYSEFSTAEECVEEAFILFEDNAAREQMMENNYQYYNQYLAPDKMVWRTLEKAIGKSL
ncbi:MAG: hypothetical protein JO080_05750 [Mucilaginibacter sp.]|nr:hypothetical protein [Mucilaginibacter sp.]